jgi:hypothetical protein
MSYSKEEIKEAGLDDFRVFLKQVWDYLGLPEPTPVQYDIAYYLQHAPVKFENGRRVIIQAFRGIGKSWITVAFVCWLLFIDPDLKIMVVSASQGLADDFTKFVKQLIDGMPILQHLRPREGQRDSGIKFDVGPSRPSKDPSLKSVGITGQLTGSRADVIIADDIEIPKNSFTHLLRERLSLLVKEFSAVLKPGGRIIYLGTPQTEATLYGKLKKLGYVVLVWPSEIPSKLDVYGGRLARYIQKLIAKGLPAKTPVDPKRFNEQELMERRIEYGTTGYAMQFLLDPSLADAEKHPLKARDLMIMDVDQEQGFVKLVWSQDREVLLNDLMCGGLDGDFYVKPVWYSKEMEKWQGTVMAIDPSGRGMDETSIAIIRYLYGQLYLVKVAGWVDGFGETTLQAIARLSAEYRVNYIIDEKNYGGGMFSQLLKPWVNKEAAEYIDPTTGVKGVPAARFLDDDEWNGWSSTQKEMRICDVLEPILKSHKLVVSRTVIEEDLRQQEDKDRYSFIQQLTRMQRLKGALPNDDRVEVVSMACSYFVEKMNRDKDKMLDKHKQGLLDRELRKFVKGVVNFTSRNQNPGAGSLRMIK